MELTYGQMDFIRMAKLGNPLVTETIEERINVIRPAHDALVSGDYVLILEEY